MGPVLGKVLIGDTFFVVMEKVLPAQLSVGLEEGDLVNISHAIYQVL